jgi:hypothetical protein
MVKNQQYAKRTSYNTQPRGEYLKKATESGRPQQDPQQRISAVRAALQVGFDIAGVQISNRHEKTGSGKSPQLAPRKVRIFCGGRVGRDRHGAQFIHGFRMMGRHTTARW